MNLRDTPERSRTRRRRCRFEPHELVTDRAERLVVTDEDGAETEYREGDFFLHADGRVLYIDAIHVGPPARMRVRLAVETASGEMLLTNSWSVMRHDVANKIVGTFRAGEPWDFGYADRHGEPIKDLDTYFMLHNYYTAPLSCMTRAERARVHRRPRAAKAAVLALAVSAHSRLGGLSPAGRLDSALIERIAFLARTVACRCCGRQTTEISLGPAKSADVRGKAVRGKPLCRDCVCDAHVQVIERCGHFGCTWMCPHVIR